MGLTITAMMTFTEQQLWDVMKKHRPAYASLYCLCSWPNGYVLYDAQHILEVLRRC